MCVCVCTLINVLSVYRLQSNLHSLNNHQLCGLYSQVTEGLKEQYNTSTALKKFVNFRVNNKENNTVT